MENPFTNIASRQLGEKDPMIEGLVKKMRAGLFFHKRSKKTPQKGIFSHFISTITRGWSGKKRKKKR